MMGKEITITTDIILNNGEVSVQSLGESAPIRLKVVSASCSSNLAPQGNNTYGPWNMLDGNPATVWAVNLNDPSIRNYEGDRDCIYGPWFDVKCKKLLIAVLEELLEPIRARRKEWEQKIEEVYAILEKGTAEARATAAATLHDVREAMKINYFEDKELIAEQAERYRSANAN